MTEINVSKITNIVTWKIDNNSYKRALTAIRKVASEWGRATSKINKAMAQGRTIANRGSNRSSSNDFVGPMPFSPGKNTKMQMAAAKKAAREQEVATKRHYDNLRKLRENDAKKQEAFEKRIAGQFMGPMPRMTVTKTREQLRQERTAASAANKESARSARSQEVINAGNIRRQSMYGTGGSSSMAGTIGKLNAELKSGAISLQVYRQQVAAVEREFRRAQASATTFGDNLKGLRTAFIALTAGNMLFTGGRAVMQTGQMFQGIDAAMSMTSDGASETAQKLSFLRDEAYRLGLDLKIAAQGFTQMSIAGREIMTDSQTQELFSGFSEYATALGVDQFRYEKGILAIGQMMNKQQIMAISLVM